MKAASVTSPKLLDLSVRDELLGEHELWLLLPLGWIFWMW
jgi:hypothetical protein